MIDTTTGDAKAPTNLNERCLEGKVVVVTGSGRGIGREVAILAAREGAKVVVNDIGGMADGTGSDARPAEQVVDEIRALDGEAVANHGNVAIPEQAEAIIQSAVDTYGRIDCVVNNAGILRDRIFHHMDREEFEAVIRVHLLGSFHVARAAAPYFREQQSGSFVHFTSASGLIGNYGQANYAAAKMGIVGLSKSIALDMSRYNVRSNCIAPFAWSRLIGTIPTEQSEAEARRVEKLKAMSPAKIAPLVVFLASPLSQAVTGQIFAVRQNEVFLMSQPRPIRSAHRSEGWTPASLTEVMLPAFASDFYALDRSPDVFSWEPI